MSYRPDMGQVMETCPVCQGVLVQDAEGVVYCEAHSDHYRSDSEETATMSYRPDNPEQQWLQEVTATDEMATCDFCDRKFPISTRHCVTSTRPSDRTSLCAVMWACAKCGKEMELPTNAYIESQFDLPDGERDAAYRGLLFWEG